MRSPSLTRNCRDRRVYSDAEIETAVIALGREPGGGLVVMPDAFTLGHRVPIISAAARNQVPAVYAPSFFARDIAPPMESMAGTSVPGLRMGYVLKRSKRTEFRALPPPGRGHLAAVPPARHSGRDDAPDRTHRGTLLPC